MLLLLWGLVQTNWGQQRALPIVKDQLTQVLGTPIDITRIDVNFFESATLSGITIYDDQSDTLLSARTIAVDLSLFSLWNKQIFIDDIGIDGAKIYIKNRTAGTNYDHILAHLAGDPNTKSKDEPNTQPSWSVGFEDIKLQNLLLDMSGDTTDIIVSLGTLEVDLRDFDLELASVQSDIIQGEDISILIREKIRKPGSNKPTVFPDLGIPIKIDDLRLNNASVKIERTYAPEIDNRVDPNHLHITKAVVDAENIQWDSTGIALTINNLSAREKVGIELKNLSTALTIGHQSASVSQLALDINDSKLQATLDSKYESIDALVKDFTQSNTKVNVQLAELHSRDLRRLIDNKSISSIDLDAFDKLSFIGQISTSVGTYAMSNANIKIGDKVTANGSASVRISPSLRYDADITSIKTTEAALTSIFPTVAKPAQLQNLGKIEGKLQASGTTNDITIRKMDVRVNDHTEIALSGSLNNITNAANLRADLAIEQLKTDPSLLLHEDAGIPDEIFNLGKLDFVGTFKGGLRDYDVNGKLNSDIGSADLDMEAQFNDQYNDASYTGSFDLDSFDVGKLLQDSTFGVITAAGDISGSGLNVENLDTKINVESQSFFYNGETYKDIKINGTYAAHTFTGKIVSKDDKLKFDFEGRADLDGENTVINIKSTLDRIDLTQFGIGDSLFYISGIVNGDLKGDNIDNILGSATISNLILGNQRGEYTADSTVTFSVSNNDQQEKIYQLSSEFADAVVTGNIKVSQLSQIVENYIRSYIPIQVGYEDELAVDDQIEGQADHFDIDITTKDLDPLLHILASEDISVARATLRGSFASDRSSIDFKGQIDSLMYGDYMVESGSYFFDGRQDFINGNIIVDRVLDDEDLLLQEAYAALSLDSELAGINIQLYDSKGNETMDIGGDLSQTDEYIFTFSDSVRINGSEWIFSPYNQVIYSTENGLFLQDVSLSKGKQSVTIYTDENQNGSAIELLTSNLIVSELTSIIGQENDFFEGIISGNAVVNNVWEKPFITADIRIDSIIVNNYDVGTLAVSALQNTETNTVETDIQLLGSNNNAQLSLAYAIASRALKGQLDIERIEMAALDPFLTEVLIDTRGAIQGQLSLAGTPTEPKVNGTIDLLGVQTTPVFTNTRYAILDQSITINEQAIELGDMVVVDINDNVANVSGNIFHTNLSEIYLDLTVDSEEFLFLNTSASENPLFYGNVTVAADVNMYGPIEKIKIDGSAKAINNSKLTISPFSIEQIDYENDYIVYADPRKVSLDSLNAKALATRPALPFDVDLTLSVDEDSEFEMVMNPITGDNILCNGDANLILQLRQTGELELYGTYTVSRGQYLFTYGILSREFDIQPGSRVIFNGDPLLGTLDVDAVYTTNTPVYDLLVLESGDGFEEGQITEAKRKRQVNVLLSLANTISSPEINLDIVLPERDFSSIADILDDKLKRLRSDPDELNNQVFGLLIFDNFILSSSSETDLAQTGTDLAIKSISGLVTKQLNKFADGLIKGVDFNFNVNSYSSDALASGSDGLITELGVGVSKTLFNDRLTVTAGTNIDLESSSGQSTFNNLAGDFVIEYSLTEDRRYRVKVFRKSNYDRILDENNSKNGVSLFVRNEFGVIKRKEQKD